MRGEHNGSGTFDVSVDADGLAATWTDRRSTVNILIIGDQSYLLGDTAFWREQTQAPAALDLLEGQWIELDEGNPLVAGFEDTSMNGITESFTDVPDGAVKTSKVAGEPVYLVKDADFDLIAVSQDERLPRAVTTEEGDRLRLSYDDVQPVKEPRDALTMAEVQQELAAQA